MVKNPWIRRFQVAVLLALMTIWSTATFRFAAAAQAGKAAQSAPKVTSKLAKPHTMLTGEVAALLVSQLATSFKLVETPMLIAYDADDDKIAVALFGNETTVDAAKQVIEEAKEKVLGTSIEILAATHNMKLEEGDFELGYYNVEKNTLVLEWANDEYKMH